ncbi:1484_t:CDS:2 [Dentiscutata erythropus]|uniref:1484_t:CDS:1 n=1 Tax=Dentiscutata erythropus TaxID=1348616 RepID=A0A9N9I0H3_9GLOM|nr:1484_t:CDS:2 [Dentiscutata erythropus]
MLLHISKLTEDVFKNGGSKKKTLKPLKTININQVRVLEGRGRKVTYPILEKELLKFIKKRREERGAVTTSMIIKKAKELGKVLDAKDLKFSRDIPIVVRNFLQSSREKIYNIDKKFGLSFDETPMYFDMPRDSTIDFKVATAPSTCMTGDLMISTYIPRVIRARPNGFFKSKGILFVDEHRSYIHDDVLKALNIEGLEVLQIPGGTTSVLQPPDVSMDKEKQEHTKKGNLKKVSYELVCELIAKTWREISTNILVKSFEATGLILNPNGSEDNKLSKCLRAITENNPDESLIEDTHSENKSNYNNDGAWDYNDSNDTEPDYDNNTEPDYDNESITGNEAMQIDLDYESFMDNEAMQMYESMDLD